jgi:cell wall-associated NlpC family hydrolase
MLTSATLLIAVPRLAAAAPTPPPNPTNGQISAAQTQKQTLAATVGQLGGQIASAQAQLQQLQGKQEIAEQKYALALQQLQQAKARATQAEATVRHAKARVTSAHAQFVRYLQASYMSGDVGGTAGSLLTAPDPSALLAASSLEEYQAEHQVNAIGALQTATVAKSNADAKARVAVQDETSAAAKAKQAAQVARDAYNAEQAQKVTLQNTLASKQSALATARAELADLDNQRDVYNAYVAEQARLARIRAEKAREARLRAEAAAAAAARARARHSGGGGGSSSSGGGGGSSWSPPPPSGGGWTQAKANRAVARAHSQLGVPYIFAGGDENGRNAGGCNDPIAPCGETGFDCSGLVLFAWHQNWAHYAASQYSEAGSFHPSPSQFKPGDLLFWWEDGGIGHVAIYIGGGDVIQAPQSGDVVKITPWDQVQSGYYGATRPLT